MLLKCILHIIFIKCKIQNAGLEFIKVSIAGKTQLPVFLIEFFSHVNHLIN